MASKGLTDCWRDAMAAKPSTWRLMGVACGPREVDPNIQAPRNGARGLEVQDGSGWRAVAPGRRMRC